MASSEEIPPESSNSRLSRHQDIIHLRKPRIYLFPLLEVFSVRIDYRDRNPGGLYGTIILEEEVEPLCIFNREKQDYEPMMPGNDNALSLTTDEPLLALDPIVMKLTLFDKDSDNATIHGFFSLDPICLAYEFDRLYSMPITSFLNDDECDTGKYGQVKVEFAFLTGAVVARVEVQLLMCRAVDVHGLITARSPDFRNCETMLFRKVSKLGEKVKVGPGELIPLSKSVVSVKLGSSLKVFPSLYGSGSKEIAHGIAEFPADKSGVSESVIPGKHGMICVKVTWEVCRF